MRTLFIRLFIWFWIAMTLSGIVFFLLAVNMRLGPLRERAGRERAAVARQLLVLYGEAAAAAYEAAGVTGLDASSRDAEGIVRGYLFSAAGVPLVGNPPPAAQNAVRQLLQEQTGGPAEIRRPGLLAVRVVGPSGTAYLAAAVGLRPARSQEPPGFPFPRDFWFRAAVSFVVGGLVCYFLAWRLTKPVSDLRRATQRLSAGDLSARVSTTTGGEEIAGLAYDFNVMAERIETLLTAQKQLMRDVSHELRSPLARMCVALGLARRDASAAAGASLDRIEREADRLNEMIGEMLTLTKLESGNGRWENERIDVADLLGAIVGDAAFEAAGTDKDVRLSGCGSAILSGNPEMLRRALENVVRNGIRYTRPGTAVDVLVERDGQNVVIRVRDQGPGVPEGALSEMFRPFYRVAEARDRESGGTGIGLAITAQAVQLHHGTVVARNHPSGLEVEIRLPCEERVTPR